MIRYFRISTSGLAIGARAHREHFSQRGKAQLYDEKDSPQVHVAILERERGARLSL